MPSNEYDERPWGSWELLYTSPDVTVKILRIKPRGMLSLQTHKKRAERWTPLESGLVATVGNMTIDMVPGHQVHIPVGETHRIFNPGYEKEIAVVEVITGEYDEDDIVRLQDIYDR